jgi:exodeoxyribonuclease-3
MDFEGRTIWVDFDELSVMSLYLPSGTNSARLGYKFCSWMISKLHYGFKERDS